MHRDYVLFGLRRFRIRLFLPPAYVVRRESTVFTGVCLSTGGGRGGTRTHEGVPDRVPPWGGTWTPGGYLTGYPPGGVPGPRGGTQTPRGYLTRYPLGGGGTRTRGGDLTGYPPGGGVPGPPRGGTQLGQHSEYLLHSGRYASCVHAGGLSCLNYFYNI